MDKPRQSAKIHVQNPQKSAILRIFEILKASDTGQKISFQKNSKTSTDFTLKEARNPEQSGMCMRTMRAWTDGQTDKHLEDLAQLEVENQTDQSL